LYRVSFLLFHAPATPELSTLSLHDALPICILCGLTAGALFLGVFLGMGWNFFVSVFLAAGLFAGLLLITKPREIPGKLPLDMRRSEEHTSELQSRFDLVCRLLLEKKRRIQR